MNKSKSQIMEEYFTKKTKDFYSEIDGNFGEHRISITCSGDWKHAHKYLDTIMKDLGYTPAGETNIEDTGSDWYSSTHRFVLSLIPDDRTDELKEIIKKYKDLGIGKDIVNSLEKELKDLTKLRKSLKFD